MHPNDELLTKLFRCLNAHDHEGMAECYADGATFRDIAFTLDNKRQIHAMSNEECPMMKSFNDWSHENPIVFLTRTFDKNGTRSWDTTRFFGFGKVCWLVAEGYHQLVVRITNNAQQSTRAYVKVEYQAPATSDRI